MKPFKFEDDSTMRYIMNDNSAKHTEAEIMALRHAILSGSLPVSILCDLLKEAVESALALRESKAYLAVVEQPDGGLGDSLQTVLDVYRDVLLIAAEREVFGETK